MRLPVHDWMALFTVMIVVGVAASILGNAIEGGLVRGLYTAAAYLLIFGVIGLFASFAYIDLRRPPEFQEHDEP